MSFDLKTIRRETPGTNDCIHFNNAGAALMPTAVYEAVLEHLKLELHSGGYEAHNRAMPAFERTYDAIAQLINCNRDEVALLENATAAWVMAFHGLNLQKGDTILTAEAEYASNAISYLQAAKNKGVITKVIPSDNNGQIDLEKLEAEIDSTVKLISISHIPTNGGLINPAEAVGKIAKAHGIPYLLDACQSIGQIPLDVKEIGCDMLSATGRKYLRAPRGTGFLYVREGFLDKLEPPFLDLHSATWTSKDSYEMRPNARRFENWENSVASLIGLGVAVDYFMEVGVEKASARLCELAATARQKMSAISNVTVHDLGARKGGIVTFTHDKFSAEEIKAKMAESRINVSTSTKNSTLFDMENRELPTLVRASFHYYNTEQELDLFLNVIKSL
jgi:cysteine desulfurase / selenocysteine lyase